MKILVTGFAPFNHEPINPSYEAVKLLPNEIEGAQVLKLELPVVYGRCLEPVQKVLEGETIDAILLVGQAGGRAAVTPEKVAINFESATIPDNDGNLLKDAVIDPEGPAAYFSTLPVRKIVDAMNAQGVNASLSLTAGAFVCNDLFYRVRHYLTEKSMDIPAGFIHVPFIPSQLEGKKEGTPAMELEQIRDGLAIAAAETVKSLKA